MTKFKKPNTINKPAKMEKTPVWKDDEWDDDQKEDPDDDDDDKLPEDDEKD